MDIKEGRAVGFTNDLEPVKAFDTLENSGLEAMLLQWRRDLLVLSPLYSEQH